MITLVRRWLRSRLLDWAGIRDPAPTAEAWDAQYSSGRWIPVGQLSELSRLSMLVGYLRYFSRGGAILDVGCGEGALARKLPVEDYSRYVGIDFSRAAVDKATELGLPKATFASGDAGVYVPQGTFDAIVFAEILYYFPDPRLIVERFVRSLNRDGIVLVSINTNVRGGLAIIEALKRRYATRDEVRVAHPDPARSWTCAVFSGK